MREVLPGRGQHRSRRRRAGSRARRRARREPTKRTRSPSSSSSRSCSRRARSGPSPTTTSDAPSTRATRSERGVEVLRRRQPPGEDERPAGRRAASSSTAFGHGRTGSAARVTRSAGMRHETITSARYALGQTTCAARRTAASRSSRRTRPQAAAAGLERRTSPVDEPAPARAFERRIGGELHDERRARERGAERRAADHAGRVDDVGVRARATRRDASARSVTDARRQPARMPSGRGKRCGAGGASAVVTTSTWWPRARSQPASSGAWLAGPPTSGGQIPDTIKTLTRRRRPRQRVGGRASAGAQRARTTASTSDEPKTCAPPPRSRRRGSEDEHERHERRRSRSAVPTVRMPGRPIETGNDFVQPKTSCIAAASSISRDGIRGADVARPVDPADQRRHRRPERAARRRARAGRAADVPAQERARPVVRARARRHASARRAARAARARRATRTRSAAPARSGSTPTCERRRDDADEHRRQQARAAR